MKQHELKRWCQTTLAGSLFVFGGLATQQAAAFSQPPPAARAG